jgi:hypothetical protein
VILLQFNPPRSPFLFDSKVIALAQTYALARKILLAKIAEHQFAIKIASTEVGVSRQTHVNALQTTMATTVACLYVIRDFLCHMKICQSG